VARVNGRPLDRQALQTLIAADRAMAQLLGQPMPDGRDALERLINGELVWQAAQAVGYVASDAQVSAALDAILTSHGRSRADLTTEADGRPSPLAANGLTLDAFMAYFRRLVTIDQFAQSQAQARGETVAAYVGRLQAQARISFGPAAQLAANSTVAVAPSPTPRPAPLTPTPLTPTLLTPQNWGERGAGKGEAGDAPAPLTPAPLTPQSWGEGGAEPGAVAMPTPLPSPTPSPAIARGVEIGQLAPDFAVAALMRFVTNVRYADRSAIYLADLAGKPAVLSFWTTWCPYCARQTPILVDAYRRYEPQGVEFAGIDVKEEPAAVEAYVQANGIPYPIGLDRDGQVAAAYRVSGFPTTYFLDANGRIAAKHVGQLTAAQVDGYLSSLLAR